MATYTSYYNLTKPEGTERVNIAIINQNMDAIDTQMHKNAQSIIANHGGMAIPSNNNTHAAVSSGQYVYVYNHSSLSEGLYIAKSSISTNGALSLSNLTAVSGGGLNHVYSTLNSKIATTHGALTKANNSISAVERATWWRSGNVVILALGFTVGTDITGVTETLFTGAPAAASFIRSVIQEVAGKTYHARLAIHENGEIKNAYTSGGIKAGQYEGEIVYIAT